MVQQQEANSEVKVSLSAIDEERFGVRTAKASAVNASQIATLHEYCDANQVELLIARSPTNDLAAAQVMGRAGYILTDTLVYYSRDLFRTPIPEDSRTVPVRPVRTGEEEQVRRVGAEAFTGYCGHYHADARLDRRSCDEAYADWAMRCCVGGAAGQVLVAPLDGAVAGFAALRLNHPGEGEGVLFGVTPAARGCGIYRSLMVGAMNWCKAEHADLMVISTQLTNVVAQKVWTRLGFELHHSYYTFHKWFDRP